MADEQIIIAVDIQTREAQTQLDLLAKTIEEAKNKQEDLNQKFKENLINSEEYNKATKENTKELKAAETATKSLTTAVQAENKSITALNAENRELIKQRNSISTATQEGRDKIFELNKIIDQNTQIIKDNVSGLEKNRLNVGNYRESLDGLRVTLQGIAPGLKGVEDGVMGISNGAKMLGSTPLLGIFTILSTVVPMVLDYFKSFAPVMDALEDTVNAVSGTFKGLFENFDLLIKAISGSANDWDALKTAINETRAEGQRLLDVQRELDDSYLDYQLRAAKGGVEIRRLLLEAKNRTLTEKERQDKLNEALKIEKDQREELIKLDKTAFEASVDRFIFDNSKRLKSNQELIDIEKRRADNQIAQESRFGTLSAERRAQILAERDAEIQRIETAGDLLKQLQSTEDRYERLQALRESGLFQEEDLQKAADAYAKYQSTVEGGVAIQERIQNQLDDLADKEIERNKKKNDEAQIANEKRLAFIEKINAAEKKDAEEMDAFFQKLSDDADKRLDLAIQTGLKELDIERENNEKFAKQEEEFQLKLQEQNTALQEQGLADDKFFAQQKLLILEQSVALAAGIFRKNKQLQIASTLISTYRAAQDAYQAGLSTGGPFAPVLGAIYAAQAIAQGLERVKAIRSVGETGSGTVKQALPVSITGKPRELSFGGVTETRGTTNQIDQQFLISSAFRNMPPIVASWKEATEIGNKVRFKEALTTA